MLIHVDPGNCSCGILAKKLEQCNEIRISEEMHVLVEKALNISSPCRRNQYQTNYYCMANNEHPLISMFAIAAIDPMAFVRVFSLLSNMTG